MPEPIIFYDIPRKTAVPEENAWSPNTWKTRYTLNIKGISYKTVWVEYPDVEAVCKQIGAAATAARPDGTPLYTLPTIYDSNTKSAVADSAAIVRYLDKTYPDTARLIPKETDALHAAFQRAFDATILGSLDLPAIMMPATNNALNAASEGYFRRTREARLGKLEELAPAGSEKRRKHWEGVKDAYRTIAEWLTADGEDKLLFMGGDKVCYADVTIAGFLVWMRIILGENSEEWRDVLSWDGGRWARFMEVFRKYEVVDVGSKAEL